MFSLSIKILEWNSYQRVQKQIGKNSGNYSGYVQLKPDTNSGKMSFNHLNINISQDCFCLQFFLANFYQLAVFVLNIRFEEILWYPIDTQIFTAFGA